MKFIQHYFKEITVVLLLIIAVLVGIIFWFYSNLYLVWNPDNFNNIVTPIGALIGVILVYLTLKESKKQTSLILSDSIKPHFDREIDNLNNALDLAYSVPILKDEQLSDRNLLRFIQNIYTYLTFDEEYKNDLTDFNNGTFHSLEYFAHRSYYSYIFFLQLYHQHGILRYNSVIRLIDEINHSPLAPDQIQLFKQRISREVAYEFIIYYSIVKTQKFMIPLVIFPLDSANIKFENLYQAGIRDQGEFFATNLPPP